MTIGIRTLRTSAEGLVKLMQALSADPDVRVVKDPIPPGAAVAGVRTHDHLIEVDIMSHGWPDDTDLTKPIDFMYARKYGPDATGWSAPIGVGR